MKNIICINKCDLADRRQVPFDDIKRLGENYNAPYFEASAKEGIKVNECFTELAQSINDDFVAPDSTDSSKLDKSISSNKKDKKNCAC